jgi:hypothetical protein
LVVVRLKGVLTAAVAINIAVGRGATVSSLG